MSLNEDMKPYLEQLLKNEDKKGEEALKRLQKEEEKRKKERQQEEFNKNQLVEYWKRLAFSEEQIKSLIIKPKGRAELVDLIKKAKIPKSRNSIRNRLNSLLESPRMQKDYNDARKIFDLDSINFMSGTESLDSLFE